MQKKQKSVSRLPISAQRITIDNEAYTTLPTAFSTPQRITAACPEGRSARRETGFATSSASPPRTYRLERSPHPGRESSGRKEVPLWKGKAPLGEKYHLEEKTPLGKKFPSWKGELRQKRSLHPRKENSGRRKRIIR